MQSSRWQRIADLSEKQFRELISFCYREEVQELSVNYFLKREKQFNKKAKRAAKLDSLAESIRAASVILGKKQYAVIYADPPWRFEPYSRETGMDAAADNHYPTVRTEAIMEMPVGKAEGPVRLLRSQSQAGLPITGT